MTEDNTTTQNGSEWFIIQVQILSSTANRYATRSIKCREHCGSTEEVGGGGAWNSVAYRYNIAWVFACFALFKTVTRTEMEWNYF